MEIYFRYLAAFIFVAILTRWLTRKADPLYGWKFILPALVVKIAMGSAYGYIFLHQYGGDDTWMINAEGQLELQKLFNRPGSFFEDVDLSRLVRENGWKDGLHLFREKLELAILIKPLALFNIWSKGNYYTNVVFFSGISFWGGYWLFRLVTKLRPGLWTLAYLVIFLYPPSVFWLSGIRGDGLLFFFFGLTLWEYHKWLSSQNFKHAAGWMAALGGMLVVRSAFGALMVPALLAWWLCRAKHQPVKKAFYTVYIVSTALFFCSALLPDALNGPKQVVNRQAQFFALNGNTRIPLDTLTTSPISFIRVLPQSLGNCTLRPFPWDAHGLLQFAIVIQNIFLICLLLLCIGGRFPGRKLLSGEPLFLLLLLFSLSAYLSIGYTIPFPGPLVRYRAIPETCLLVLFGAAALGNRLSNYNFFNVYKKKVI